MALDPSPRSQLEALGAEIRSRRQQAELTLRELASRTNVSGPYLSQIERGLHEPSARVLQAVATALNLSAESLLIQAGALDPENLDDVPTVEDAIHADTKLSKDEKAALLAVYRSFLDD